MTLMPDVGDKTFRDSLDEQALAHPDHMSCNFEGSSLTLRQWNEQANRLANGLLGLGLTKGDHVGIMLPGHSDHIVTIFSLAEAGGAGPGDSRATRI